MSDNIKKISNLNLEWVNITNPGHDEIEYLRAQYKFHQLNLEDAYGDVRSQRAKYDEHEDYLFLVLHFPVYDKKERRIIPAEVDLFIGSDYIITIHNNELLPIKELFKLCDEFHHYRSQYMAAGPSVLLYEILKRLLEYCFPMIDHLGEDIEKIEDRILEGKEREMVKEILWVKRNITNFRKIMQSHKNVIKKLIQTNSEFFPKIGMTRYYHDLMDQTKDIWEILNTERETIDAIYETNESSLSFKLNDIIKTLTIFSVVVFPLTLIASIFGMNAKNFPIIGHKFDFWIIISLMIIMTLLMFLYFKKKKWI